MLAKYKKGGNNDQYFYYMTSDANRGVEFFTRIIKESNFDLLQEFLDNYIDWGIFGMDELFNNSVHSTSAIKFAEIIMNASVINWWAIIEGILYYQRFDVARSLMLQSFPNNFSESEFDILFLEYSDFVTDVTNTITSTMVYERGQYNFDGEINNESDDKTGDDKTGADKTSDDKTGGNKTSDDKTVDDKTSDDKIDDDKTSDDKTVDDKIDDDKTNDNKIDDDKTGDDKIDDDKYEREYLLLDFFTCMTFAKGTNILAFERDIAREIMEIKWKQKNEIIDINRGESSSVGRGEKDDIKYDEKNKIILSKTIRFISNSYCLKRTKYISLFLIFDLSKIVISYVDGIHLLSS